MTADQFLTMTEEEKLNFIKSNTEEIEPKLCKIDDPTCTACE